MKLKEWNTLQIAEALGEVSRYFFWKHHNRDPFDNDELVLFYILNDGARNFREKNKQESEAQNEQEKQGQTYEQTSSP